MRLFFILLLTFGVQKISWSQDSIEQKSLLVKSSLSDSSKIIMRDTLKHHNPRLATRYSALLPGLGQAYNKQYWKIPIVYGALAIPVSTYIYNNDLYLKTKFAYNALLKQKNGDPSDVDKIDPSLKSLSIGSLQSYRNIFRRDRDYSILWFFIGWGVNVIDATIFGHLKEFDVSNDLSMHIVPVVQPQIRQAGLSLQFNLKNTHSR